METNTDTKFGTGKLIMKEAAVSRVKFVKPYPEIALTYDDYFKPTKSCVSSFNMGCILNPTSSVLEAGGIGYRSISTAGTIFRLLPTDLYWMCLGGYDDDDGQFVMVGGIVSVEFERDTVSMLGCCKIIKHISESIKNKTTDRFHVLISVENISYLTRFKSGNDFTVYETVWHCQL